ncbi:hypothetical protein E1A91_D06G204600v1 [Gossypium mustelinum]|uniref:Leucine-rich repeat-containing N-terminal plant-type domain-containing protein n=1 Tax=Gossypium mustelinum TaxID=34275 RepID=A0A5D2ULD4_GOSMU|nr:hypothetical protein E1A91_D06G204600v1 [Gossypium mustelinum]
MGSLCLVLVVLQLSWSMSSSVPPSSSHLCLPHQRDALLHFKTTISVDCDFYHDGGYRDDPYPRIDIESWYKSIDCCSWEGVKCNNVTGDVIGMDLSHSCLVGSLFAGNSLFQLHNLQWLDLSSNNLRGSLLENTSSLFHFHGLQRLNLADNGFDGIISSKLFSQFVSLTHLNISYNGFFDDTESYLRFDGQGFDMLARNLTKLRNLMLDTVECLIWCQLHGEFPTQAFQLPNLKVLDLSGNKNLASYLPNKNWSSGLELLDLSECGFRGSIPASFGNLTQIISVGLEGNSLEGQIPDVFGNLRKLTSLSFSSCNLSGPLPITIFNLSKITQLDLSYNHLEGPFPNHVSELQFLEELWLSYNSISGGVPSWQFTLPSLLQLDLSYNKLMGPIDRIQKPSPIQEVYLSYNNISGSIPCSIFYLVNLTSLDLSSNNLSGPIPDSIFDLVNLTSLDLSSNNLSGVIKSDMLSKLTSLEFLDVSSNSLLSLSTSGNDVNSSFPQLTTVIFSGCSVRQFPSFFRTSKLTFLNLSNNLISSGISKWEAEGWEGLISLDLSHNFLTALEQFPGNNLGYLNLRSNLLQGPILSTCLNPQIPSSKELSVIIISKNKLTGNIPSSICNLSSLDVLDLSENSLSGTISDYFGNLRSLEFLNLQMNNFYGKIPDSFVNSRLVPPSLANSISLEVLNIGKNKLTDRFPNWLASLPKLQILILRFNRFHGSLPHSIASSSFSALRIIDLSVNEFTGTLPTKLFQNLRAMKDKQEWFYSTTFRNMMIYGSGIYEIPVNVTTKRLELELTEAVAIFVSMDLSNNQFCGKIPEEVGQLVYLQMLNFSQNNFIGPIPASFGNLVALESLDLSSNKLGGRIPFEMTNLTFLEVLNLSENNLVGPISHGNQFNTFSNDSYSGNLGLCGLPLSKQCSEIPFFWQVVMMGYVSGVVLGLSMGYIIFTTGRPWWFVRKVERDWQYNFKRWVQRNRVRRN